MPGTIISPSFSFVRFSDQHLDDANWMDLQIPGAELGMILPVVSHTDLAFQFIVDFETPVEAEDFCATQNTANMTVMLVAGANLPAVVSHATYATLVGLEEDGYTLGVERYRLNATQVLFYIPRLPDPTIPGWPVACGGCFQIAIRLDVFDSTTPIGISNIFSRQCVTDFTTVLNYFSEKDEAGFVYCVSPTIKNRVRFPLYLTRPLYPETEEEHRQSNGAVRIRKSVVTKTYEVVTDLMPTWIIECLRMIWLHEDVFTGQAVDVPQVLPYEGEIVKQGSFEPQYSDYKNYPLATVKFRVEVTPFLVQKNNCGECFDYTNMFDVTNLVAVPVANTIGQVVDLIPATDNVCCSPLKYELEYFQDNYISGTPVFNIVPPIGLVPAVAEIVYSTAATFTSSPSWPPPFMLIRVTCGATSKVFAITSSLP